MDRISVNGTVIEVQDVWDDGTLVIQEYAGVKFGESPCRMDVRYEPAGKPLVYNLAWRVYAENMTEFGETIAELDFGSGRLGYEGFYDTWDDVEYVFDYLLGRKPFGIAIADAYGLDLGDARVD
jgi:hypothetical protein